MDSSYLREREGRKLAAGAGGGGGSGPFTIRSRGAQPARVNPTPVATEAAGGGDGGVDAPWMAGSMGPASDDFAEEIDFLSEANLKQLSGEDDLSAVRYLEISVNTREQSVAQLGEMLPALRELKLNDSVLASVRDLGVALWGLEVVWLRSCGLKELDGVGSLEGLKELYLAYNDISDLTPLMLHDNLEVLDVEANNVAEMRQLDSLGTCSKLRHLSLSGNPMASRDEYRRLVVARVPQLETLDDEDITDDDRIEPSTAALEASLKPLSSPAKPRVPAARLADIEVDMTLGADLADMVADLEGKDAERTKARTRDIDLDESLLLIDSIKTSRALEASGDRTLVRPASAGPRRRPMSAQASPPRARLGATERPRTASASRRASLQIRWEEFTELVKTSEEEARSWSAAGSSFEGEDQSPREATGASDLTSGLAFAGNPASAIRRRRKRTIDPDKHETITSALDRAAEMEGQSREDVFRDLKSWDLDAEVAKLKANPQLRARLAEQRPGTSGGRLGRGVSSPQLVAAQTVTAPRIDYIEEVDPSSTRSLDVASPVHPRSARFKEFSTGSGPIRTALSPTGRDSAGAGAVMPPSPPRRPPTAPARPSQRLSRPATASALLSGAKTSPLKAAAAPAAPVASLPQVDEVSEAADVLGEGYFQDDDTLVEMLRKKPKEVPQIRTSNGFKRFFRGFPKARMHRLLMTAYSSLEKDDQEAKAAKRMRLLDGLLTNDPDE